MRKKKFGSYLRRTLALTLAFTILGSSTSIPEALINSGLVDYLGAIGRNIVTYYKSNYVYADPVEGELEDVNLTEDDVTAIIYDYMSGVDMSPDYHVDVDMSHNCDHSATNTKLEAIKVAAEAIKEAMGTATDKGTLTSMVKQILEDTGLMQEDLKIIKEEHLSAIVGALYDNTSPKNEDGSYKNPDDVDEWIGGRSVANLLLYYSDLMESWFEFSQTAGPEISDEENTEEEEEEVEDGPAISSKSLGIYALHDGKDELDQYSYYTIANNISSTRKTLQLGLGYTQPDGDLLNPDEDPDIKDLFWDKDKVGYKDDEGNVTKYIEVRRDTRNLSNEVSNIWYNLNDNFGYFQYSSQGKMEGEEGKQTESFTHWSDWNASLARDFRELLSMYRIYNVAHVYSLNSELDASWQPTPEELTYAKERVLNNGYVNAYLGFWQTKAADYNSHKASMERYNEILGDDITTSHEAYLVEVLPYVHKVKKTKTQEVWSALEQTWVTVDFEYEETQTDYILNAEHVKETMKLEEPITLSDAVRILYRALGQDVITYYTYTCADPNITLETSPCSVGLPNPLSLTGDSVYVAAVRNNLTSISVDSGTFGYDSSFSDAKVHVDSDKGFADPDDNIVDIKYADPADYIKVVGDAPKDVYLAKAHADGVVSESFDAKDAQEYQLTNAEFWVLASNLMQIYGEPAMNSTETLSLLQVYGDAYPIQAGNQIADAWAYLKARGVLGEEDDTVSNYMNALDALNIATRIKDTGSRLNYKEINLTISLDQAVVDNGFFPLFDDRLELVENYNTTKSYDYENSLVYNVVIPLDSVGSGSMETTVKVGRYTSAEPNGLDDTDQIGVSRSTNTFYPHLLLSIPYSLTDINRVEVTYQGTTYVIPNAKLAERAGVAVFDESNTCTDMKLFDNSEFNEYKSIFAPYVDHGRHKSSPTFSVASWGTNVAERIEFFFEYIFTPHKAYAANPVEPTGSTSPVNGDATTAEITYTLTGSPQNIYLTMLAILHPYHAGYGNSAIAKSGTSLGLLVNNLYVWKPSSMTSGAYEDTYLGIMNTAQGVPMVTPMGKTLSGLMNEIDGSKGAVQNLVYMKKYAKSYSKKYGFFFNKTSVSSIYGPSGYHETKEDAQTFINENPDATESSNINKLIGALRSGDLSYDIEAVNGSPIDNNVTLTLKSLNEAKLLDVISWINSSDAYKAEVKKLMSEYVTDKTDEDPNVSDSGYAGGTYEEVRDMYPDQIMNRNSDMYIAYQELVDKGIVQTRTTPKPDENGCISFYLTDRGQVVIDTINNTVSVNCIYLNMSNSVSPTYQTSKDLYINYNCLVGALATYETTDVTSEEIQTSYGTGGNAVYQLCTGIVASDRIKTVTVNTYNVENGPTTSIKSHLIYEYNDQSFGKVTEGEDGEVIDEENPTVNNLAEKSPKVLLLSGVFPTANWVIVESDQGAYLYTFYNRKMFDYAYKNDNLSASLSGYWSADYMHPESLTNTLDGVLSDAMTGELPTTRRVKVGDKLVLDELEKVYNSRIDYYDATTDGVVTGSADGVPILKNTIYSLLSLANETNSTVLGEDLLCRRFTIPYWTSLDNQEEQMGKVGYLETVGYVYYLPSYVSGEEDYKGYDHNAYVKGEYWLPYEFNHGNVIEYNLNTYGNVTKQGDSASTFDLPYGYIVKCTTSYDEDGEGYDSYEASYVLHSNSDSRFKDGEMSVQFSGDSSSTLNIEENFSISEYNLVLNGNSSFIAAPVGLFKEVTSIVKDKVNIGTLSKYTTSQCSFYLGSRRLVYVNSATKGTTTGFNFYNADAWSNDPLFSLENSGLATVVTRDYYGRHHFVLSPNTTVVNTISINTVDADDYAIDYSDNPFYSGIKAWITNLDKVSSVILYVLFYIIPYVLLLWVLLLIMLALIPRSAVRGVSTLIGIDIISVLTIGRRDTAVWHGYKVVVPLIIAFVSLGLFYGPNLLRMIEIVSDWAYKLSGLV